MERLQALERSQQAAHLLEEYASYGSSALPSKSYRKGHANVSPDAIRIQMIPVLSMIQAGQATDFSDLPVDEFTDTVAYDGRDKAAFALRIEGDSMEPKFSPGMIITVNPSIAPRNGQLVAAKIKEEGVLFKLFHHSGDGKTVTLTSYNSLYPALSYPREKFHWIYPVVAAHQRF
jgi:phage repressor protein C with HTH and peptisase S24 domain